jgi:GAF domain-containing protein
MSSPETKEDTAGTGEDPIRDRHRLTEIAELDLFSSEVREILDEVVTEASRRLALPISLVSVVLDEAQHFAASTGLTGWLRETQGSPVEWSFCANAVRSGEPFVVEDATTHPLTKDNPLVYNDAICCYAGIPLVTSRDHIIGTLCVIGDAERSFSPEDLDQLQELATEAIRRIEARRPEAA